MNQNRRPRASRTLAFEPLEGRALMSMAPPAPPVQAAQFGDITTDPAAVAAILAALRGGPGNEFATLLRRQVPNVNAVVRSFVTGQRDQFAVRGVALQIPNFQSAYTGQRFDNFSITAAGAVAQRGNRLQVGAILLGPFDENVTTEVVFGIDRGSGAARGPLFAQRPSLTPDALVTLTVGPNGSSKSGTITDLNTGSVTPIDPAKIRFRGSTIRAIVPLSALPSTGARLGQYRFATWTRNATQGGGFESIGSFAVDGRLIPIGLLGANGRSRPGMAARPRQN